MDSSDGSPRSSSGRPWDEGDGGTQGDAERLRGAPGGGEALGAEAGSSERAAGSSERAAGDAGADERSLIGRATAPAPEAATPEAVNPEAVNPEAAGAGAGAQVTVPLQRPLRRRNAFVEALALVVTALVLALTLKTHVAEAYEIKGSSMLPTFHNGERVVVLKSFYDVHRGDIIIFSSTEDPRKDLIKRVIGLPGEIVEIRDGHVLVDGRTLEEDYLDPGDPLEAEFRSHSGLRRNDRWVVGPGEYWVLGDNRGDSHDSRKFAGVPGENIKGKVVVRWWPLGDLRSF